jgi:transglutaminase-like putative cysteine protease
VVLTYHTTDLNPQYLQMFVLGNLTNTGWTMSPGGKGALPAGSAGALPPIPGNPGGKWPAAHTTIQIRPGALSGDTFLPVPYAPRDLDSPGAWLADPSTLMLYTDSSQSMSGLKYTVTSLDVDPSATDELNKPLAPGAMRQYLAVPPAYKSLTRQARQIVKNAAGPGAEAAALESYFVSGRFKYSLNPGGPGGAAGVKYFLEKSRTGYCQQFAFAMAVLARLLGIPARVVVGYTAGTGTGNGTYTVETSDAHAWPELYFRGFGWLRMEPTPAGRAPGQGTAFAPAYSLPPNFAGHPGAGSFTTPNHAGTASTGSRRLPVPGGFGRKGGDPVGTSGAAAGRGHGAGGASALLIALATLLAVALITPRAARSLIRRRRWLTAHSDAARAHAAWSELLDDLADYGIRRHPGQTPRAVAKSVTALLRLPEPGRQALLRITQAEEQASYARQPSPSGALRADVVTVRDAISGSVTKSARWRARLLTASAVDRTRLALSHALDVFGWLEVATARIRRSCSGREPPTGLTRSGRRAAAWRRPLLPVAFLAAPPALLEPLHESLARVRAAALVARGCRAAPWRGPVHVPPAGQRPHGAGEHDQESRDAHRDVLDDDTGDQQADTQQEPDGSQNHPAPVVDPGITCADALRELRILGIQRLFDLFKHALLMLRERHGASHAISRVSRVVLRSPSPHIRGIYAQDTRAGGLRGSPYPHRSARSRETPGLESHASLA